MDPIRASPIALLWCEAVPRDGSCQAVSRSQGPAALASCPAGPACLSSSPWGCCVHRDCQGWLCSHQVFADRTLASLGLGCFQEMGLTLTRQPQRPHPWPRDCGIGVFATFLKTCGILLVIILCLQFILVLSILHLFSWNMVSYFQLNVQISSLMEGLAFETLRFCSPLGSLPPVLRWVFSAPTSTNLSAFPICFHFHLHR